MSRKAKDAERMGVPVGGEEHRSESGTQGEPNAGPPEAREGADTAADQKPDSAKEIEELRAQLKEKHREVEELKDKYLRTLAESENARKRIRYQADESVRIQREALLRELLPIVDDLERAVDAARDGGNGKSIVEGVELVLNSLHDFLKAQGVTPLTSIGQQFNPEHHEAIALIESDVHAPNTVVEEVHRGYQIGERVLRPARVTVSKHPEASAERRNGGEDDTSDR
jgi:molecular chaperone GrpE